MPTPNLLPQQRAFREAIEFHRSRVPISDREISRISFEAKQRAFWVSGLTRQASAVEAHRLLDEALVKGSTAAEFRTALTKLMAENGGSMLPAYRQNNIFRTNVGMAYADGRMRQLMDPDILAERPILMYPKEPHDDKTSAICLKFEGFMAEATSPVWNHIAPPNHHQERHLTLQSLTREQAATRGTVWQDKEGIDYPVIDGQQILPDAGFNHPPSMMATDGKALAEELVKLVSERPAKLPGDYDLAPLGQVGTEGAIAMPDLAPAVDAEAWATLRDLLRFKENLDSTLTGDLFGDGVIVNRGSFDAIFGVGTPELAPLLPELLTEATEVWFIPWETAEGVTVVKRYIGVFSDGDSLLYLWADQAPSGWLSRGGVATAAEVEDLRRGFLASTRAPKTGAKP